MKSPKPSRRFLASQIHWVMARGVPGQDAEDVVYEAWEKASATFDPQRGSFESFMHQIVRNKMAYWWRRRSVETRAVGHLRLVADEDSNANQQAQANQKQLLDALTTEERGIFAGWALQRHLGKGRITAVQVAESLELEVSEYEAAKKRLRRQLNHLLQRFGWTVTTLLNGDDDVHRTG